MTLPEQQLPPPSTLQPDEVANIAAQLTVGLCSRTAQSGQFANDDRACQWVVGVFLDIYSDLQARLNP